MKINSISAQNFNKTSFNGLWGKSHYSYSESLYGGEFECDYYEKTYYPCKDETQEQIQDAVSKKQDELKELNAESAKGAQGIYIYPVVGRNLNVTLEELKNLKQDSKDILDGNIPQNYFNDILA